MQMSDDTNWICPRTGLGSAWSSLTNASSVIGYLGASTLAQKDGYRPGLQAWLCKASANEHRAVNAGLGANGSICSVFVMDRLVLAHSPVLCFIDLSVIDVVCTPLPEVGPAMEGIVRKLLSRGTQICFLHMYRGDRHLLEMDEVIRIHEMVAEHYQIPSLNIGMMVEQQILNGSLTHDSLFRDVVHTHPAGAAMLTDYLATALPSIFKAGSGSTTHPVERLFRRSYESTKIVECSEAMFLQGKSSGNGIFRLFYTYKTIAEGNPVAFTASDGEVVGIIAIVGKESGVISVVSNGISKDYLLWDAWCNADRVQTIIFDSPVEPAQQLQLVATNKEFDSSGHEWMKDAPRTKSLRLVGFLVRQV